MNDLLGNYMQFLGAVRALEGDRRTADAEDFAHRARLRAKEIEGRYLDLDASGDLGDARLANIHDARVAGLFDSAGWYLGVMDRRFLFLNADGHNLIYARTGGGKGTTSALPNLAHCRSSMFVIDVKDAELAKASSVHRALNLGHEVIVLDPWGITGHPSARVNPLHRLAAIVEAGGEIDAEADEIALILLPPGKADAGDNSWVRKGARRLLSLRMKYLAYEAPHRLALSELWRFVNASDGQLQASFADMRGSPREDVAGTAAYMLSVMLEAPKQFERLAASTTQRRSLELELSKLDRGIAQLVDRIVACESDSLVKTYEARIREMEMRKIEIREKAANVGKPKKDFPVIFKTAMRFLANPYNIWASGEMVYRRMVLKLAFADRVTYLRGEGFKTVDTALPFKMLGQFQSEFKEMVDATGIEPVTPSV